MPSRVSGAQPLVLLARFDVPTATLPLWMLPPLLCFISVFEVFIVEHKKDILGSVRGNLFCFVVEKMKSFEIDSSAISWVLLTYNKPQMKQNSVKSRAVAFSNIIHIIQTVGVVVLIVRTVSLQNGQ